MNSLTLNKMFLPLQQAACNRCTFVVETCIQNCEFALLESQSSRTISRSSIATTAAETAVKDKGRRYSIAFGMRHAFNFGRVLWKQFECTLDITMAFGGQPMNKFFPFQPNLAALPWPRKDARLRWSGLRTRTKDVDARMLAAMLWQPKHPQQKKLF